jgi:hypothetical protein
MASNGERICRVQVRIEADGTYKDEKHPSSSSSSDGGSYHLVPLADCPVTPEMELREQWCRDILRQLGEESSTPDPPTVRPIRPWDITLHLEGFVNLYQPPNGSEQSVNEIEDETNETDHNYYYPLHFRIPPETLHGLAPGEVKIRTELFALGGLFYEILSLHKPFHDIDNSNGDNEEAIQSRYRHGEFPDDVWALRLAPIVLSCWSLEFAGEFAQQQGMYISPVANLFQSLPFPQPPFELTNNNNLLATPRTLRRYIRENPAKFAFQAIGATALAASFVTVPVLGAVGFSAIGPVAGSAAAGWQASTGLVQAGSFFAWCQSAAMGGAALNGIFACGVTGAGFAGAATKMMGSRTSIPENELREMFQRVVRRA